MKFGNWIGGPIGTSHTYVVGDGGKGHVGAIHVQHAYTPPDHMTVT